VDSDCGVASVAVKLHSVQFLAVLWVLVLKWGGAPDLWPSVAKLPHTMWDILRIGSCVISCFCHGINEIFLFWILFSVVW
jgi:hypothetical protein